MGSGSSYESEPEEQVRGRWSVRGRDRHGGGVSLRARSSIRGSCKANGAYVVMHPTARISATKSSSETVTRR
jgi:hypothetical protein